MKLLKKILDLIHSINSKINGHPYAHKHKFYFWLQYIRLYIIVRVFNSSMQYNWINDINFIVDVNDWAFARNCYLGLNEFNYSCFALHYLRDDDLFIDVGANLGHYSLLVGSISNSDVISFEPDKKTFLKLKKNIELNKLDNIKIYNLGLGDKNEDLFLKSMRNNGHNYIVKSDSGHEKIKITQLNQLDIKTMPSLIKIDVEGYEKKVLQGATKILKNQKLNAMIIEISHHCERYQDTINDILKLINEYGFKAYDYNPFSRQLTTFDLDNISLEQNIIFIRNLNNAQNLLDSAKHIKIDNKFKI